LIAAAIAASIASCSREKSESAAGVATSGMQPAAPDQSIAAQRQPSPPHESLAAEGAVADAVATNAAPAQSRMIVRTANVAIVVRDAERVMRDLTNFAAARGGYVAEARSWREGSDVRGRITLRVPVSSLDAALGAVRSAAVRVESENVSGQDVTEEFTDLRAQLVNLEAAETELRELLTSVRQRTQKASDVLEVYRELVKIRGEIERIRGRMQVLSNLAELATIHVDLIPDQLAKPVVEPGWRPLVHVVSAFRALVDALQWLAGAAIWLLVLVLPLVALLLAPVVILVAVLRRRKRAKSEGAQQGK
jgi:hypothetical protein